MLDLFVSLVWIAIVIVLILGVRSAVAYFNRPVAQSMGGPRPLGLGGYNCRHELKLLPDHNMDSVRYAEMQMADKDRRGRELCNAFARYTFPAKKYTSPAITEKNFNYVRERWCEQMSSATLKK